MARAVVVFAVAVVLLGCLGFGKAFFELDSSFALQTDDPLLDLNKSSTSFLASYFAGDVATLSNQQLATVFFTDGTLTEKGFGIQGIANLSTTLADRRGSLDVSVYYKGDVVVEWPVGTWSVIPHVSFSTLTSSLSRLWTSCNISAYGVSFTGQFDLTAVGSDYATGLSLELSGTTLAGMGVAFKTTFGIPTEFDRETTGAAPVQTPSCKFDFSKASVSFSGLPFTCLYVDVETTLTCAGYKSTAIDFDLELWDGAVTLDGMLEFSVQRKSLTFIPSFSLSQNCIWVNIGIVPEVLGTSGGGAVEALIVRGVGMTNEEVDSAALSAIAALNGRLLKKREADDIWLRATGYYVALAPGTDPTRYEQTDYDAIVSIEKGFANSEFALDIYFGPGGSCFDLALVTAEWTHQLASGVELQIGLRLDPVSGDHQLVFACTVQAFLP